MWIENGRSVTRQFACLAGFLAVVVSLLLVATAVASLWLMASSGVFSLGGDG